MKILYVEDDLKIADAFVMFLKMFHEVVHAENGKEGLAKLNENKDFDVIFTDISMPEMNGLDMLEKIRETNKDIPVYIISAFDDSDLVDRAFALGVKSYIEKPIRLKEILQMLKDDLGE